MAAILQGWVSIQSKYILSFFQTTRSRLLRERMLYIFLRYVLGVYMRSLNKNASSPEAGKLAGAPRIIAQMALGLIHEAEGKKQFGK